MFDNFTAWHIPPLFVATATTFGGLMPFWNAAHAIGEFGLPNRIAISKEAQAVMITASGRTSALGLALFAFYSQGKFREVDTIMMILAYVGLVDGYVCWREGVPGRAIFRATSGLLIAAWGWFGMTS
ncbi:hypothetical protein McanMca71_000741 [Microsporum canis]|uniref:Uncharacterized protein n=1 Tax=Arthroderma otae (strain ATCC MYA-4605 / CBS 113480) TaxID=554155 RepID=C5FLI3_ARTOC|nr:conserved hypothetical protein [Microsporum canis CBS 113480]EEQ30555.1 conserved hypothetical protein [Microsporum canis CBS 113480]